MSTIAFIGLGVMGLPMATNLVAAGHRVIGVNRGAVPRDALEQAGGESTVVLAQAVREADVIITMLPDSPDVEGVMLGDGGILAFARKNSLVIDMSSIAPASAIHLSAAAADRGLAIVDAPVSGGESGAIAGKLSIMVGGEPEAFGRAEPYFAALGTTVRHVGPAGAGQTVKAANQLLVAGIIGLVSEALVFLDAYSVDLETAASVLAGGLAGNRILDQKVQGMLAHEFVPGFRLELHHKDLGNLMDAARSAGVTLPVSAVVAQLVGAANARGNGSLDHSALLLELEGLSARTIA
ncbi:NAD(P)-dependent oxidoreductase [Glaciibacter superstes]|uniref:NAD(P)-dependent oxidoreductase n=1 Tax=Glaciibacter superstes TaxID=501023 RepID=UPI0003B6A3D7|nr:NAD(P)-binding domain-containing protein [Glaciibacter superstes]